MQACVGAKVLQSALYDVQCTCTGPRSLESALCVSKGDAICVFNGLVCVLCTLIFVYYKVGDSLWRVPCMGGRVARPRADFHLTPPTPM